MSAPDELPVEPTSPSMAARLRERFGAEVDPCIELEGASEREAAAASAPSAPSASSTTGTTGTPSATGVIDRLGARGQSASRYTVRGEIARGGMGAILDVYDADLRRRLAMKVVLDRETGAPGSSARTVDPTVLSRFLEEAQVTGQLDHPCIVPVHELGLDPNGQVYFTMRLVRGRDLETIYALASKGEEGWTTTRALGVLLKVCEAMAYAHSKGVVHRDLKPANVMVGRFGEVYVMDWGLARVRDRVDRHDVRVAAAGVKTGPRAAYGAQSVAEESAALPRADAAEEIETDRRAASRALGDDALHTVDGEVIGTPSYMSPEQARGALSELDERTDVYAVGAMLYRLLTGVAPHMSRTERRGARRIWELVLEGPPERVEHLAPGAPPELVAICEKAMSRDRSARYADMLALAEDLRAFLEDRVVHAFETGAVAEAKKWVSRNRPLAAAMAGGVLALIAGLVMSLVFMGEARDNAELAEVRRKEADQNAVLAESRRVQAETSAELAETRRAEAESSAKLAEERRVQADASAKLAEDRRVEADNSAREARRQAAIAQETNAFLNDDVLAALAPEHQGVDVTMKEVLDRAALTLGLRGLAPEVESALRMTIGMSYSKLGVHEPARVNFARALELRERSLGERAELSLQSRTQLAGVLAELGQFREALELYRKSLPIARQILGEKHRGTLALLNDYALALSRSGRTMEARRQYEAVIAAQDEALSPNDPNVITAENNLASLDLDTGRYSQAVEGFEHVVQRREQTLGLRDPETLRGRANLALALLRAGRPKESEVELDELVPMMREVFGADHPSVARVLGTLGTLLHGSGRMREAEVAFEEALKILEAKLGGDHPDTLLARHNLAESITDPKRGEEVLALHRAVFEAQKRTLGPTHRATLDSLNSIAGALRVLARYDEAEAAYRELAETSAEALGSEHPFTLIVRENLGNVLYSRRDYAGAEEIGREVLELRQRVLGDAHPDVAKSTFNLAMVLKGKGDVAEALTLFQDALEHLQRTLGAAHPFTVDCAVEVGNAHMKLEHWADAATAYQAALAGLREANREDAETAYVLHQIGAALAQSKDDAGALAWFERAQELREKLQGPDAQATRASLFYRASTLHRLARYSEAEPLALELQRRTAKDPTASEEALKRARTLLFDLYTAWGKPDKAEEWR